MKLVIIGPGIQSIPPKGWGAVESLIWDYKIFLERYYPHITVVIVNEHDMNTMIKMVNDENPDVVHLHYDEYIWHMKKIKCKHIIITSHYGYIHQMKERYETDGYSRVLGGFVNSRFYIFCLSPQIRDIYIEYGCESERLYIQHNGANDEIFKYVKNPKNYDKSIYLAKIDPRKMQYKYQDIPSLYFAGKYDDARFNIDNPKYLGEWTKDYLYKNLTEYANLVLLSDGEAHALVCCEALICGLGLVISEYAIANLDTTLPFIDVIPNNKLDDITYVNEIISKNRVNSLTMREQIRNYGLRIFGWKRIVDTYVENLQDVMSK